MRIKAFITTYDREEMLTKTVKHLNSFGIIPTIKDDGSDYPIKLPQYFRHKHRGKKRYWETWFEMFNQCRASSAELFLFMPDDFEDLCVNDMIRLHNKYKSEPYVYNIINDGRLYEWNRILPSPVNMETIRVGFTDCGFFCNREALESIDFTILAVNLKRWEIYGEQCSSGVGQQLTQRFNQNRVAIYKPVLSLAYHGDHVSKMHEEERKRNPLISR